MDRRDFLKGAAAGVAGTTVAGGCATAGPALPAPASSVAEMDAFLARLDRGLEAIDRGGPLPGVAAEGTVLEGPGAEEGAALVRRTVRTLYAVGSFGELRPADQLHPGVQARMWRLLPEIEEVTEAHGRLLAGLRPSDHQRLQARLRADPGLPIRLAEALDGAATSEGLGPSRRGRLRLAATEVATRLRTQPPALLVGEYLDKVRRIEERGHPLGSARRALVARMGEAAFWEHEAWARREALAWRERLARAGSADGEVRLERASAATATGGAKLLAWGIAVGGVSALIMSTGEFGAVFGVTVGVILVLVGLVALLVALAQRIFEGTGPQADAAPPAQGEAPATAEPAPSPPRAGPPAPVASDPAAR